jgi:hypothetical protein
MKAPFLAAVALVAVAFAGVAQAGPGPISPLYLTSGAGGSCTDIQVVQGNSVIQTFPAAYNPGLECPIAVYGDVRTAGYVPGAQGGQYTLGGTPTGTFYVLPSTVGPGFDSTSDGSHNYLVDWDFGTVYQTARDYTNPTALFGTGRGYELGITYDTSNQSLWIANWLNNTVSDYSLSGVVLSSFSTAYGYPSALALDPADHTLWLVNRYTGNLEQYSTTGVLLSTGPYVGIAQGGEFNLAPTTPEPGTLIMFGSGILGLAGVLRRKINL